MNAPLAIETNQLKKAAFHYRATNHKLRQEILQLLHKRGKLTVTAIYQELKLGQAFISQHLGILRKARLVIAERDGKCVYYSVNYERLNYLHTLADNLLKQETKQVRSSKRDAVKQ